MVNDDGEPARCSCCGGEIGDFEELVERLEEACEGHDEGDVVNALCLKLGGILADAEPHERPKLRRVVGSLISDAMRLCVEADAEAPPVMARVN